MNRLARTRPSSVRRSRCRSRTTKIEPTKCVFLIDPVPIQASPLSPCVDSIVQSHWAPILSAPDVAINIDIPVWEYDVFVNEVSQHHVVHVNLPQDGKSAHVTFVDGSERDILLPDNYDHISYLMRYNVHISISKNNVLSMFTTADIILFAMQLVLVGVMLQLSFSASRDERDERDGCDIDSNRSWNSKTINHTKSITPYIMSMSSLVGIDFVNGIIKGATGSYCDIAHVCSIMYTLYVKYDDINVDIDTCPAEYFGGYMCKLLRIKRVVMLTWKRVLKRCSTSSRV